jgi:hypothetical protein
MVTCAIGHEAGNFPAMQLANVCATCTALPSLESSTKLGKGVWDVRSAEEIPVCPVLLNSQVPDHCKPYILSA